MIEFKRKHFVILVAAILFAAGVLSLTTSFTEGESGIDLSKIESGFHVGESKDYDDAPLKVRVFVANGKIAAIDIIEAKDDEFITKSRDLIKDIIENQSLQVDAVSGATISSEAVKSAVKDALRK